MASLKQNTQDIVDCLSNILSECNSIEACIDDIDYDCIETTPIDKYLNMLIGFDRINKSCVGQNIDKNETDKIEGLLNVYKEDKNILSLVLFLIKICNTNNALAFGSYVDFKEYIYNKLFNEKERV